VQENELQLNYIHLSTGKQHACRLLRRAHWHRQW
jgi:hypothetical protein